jgi:hypothetical protein
VKNPSGVQVGNCLRCSGSGRESDQDYYERLLSLIPASELAAA